MPRSARNTEFDRRLGANIRRARVAAQMSQSALGEALGISFQQVQKYELGKDRVAAEVLVRVAVVVNRQVVDLLHFDDATPAVVPSVAAIRADSRIAEKLDQLAPPVRRRMVALIDALLAGPALAVFEEDAEQPAVAEMGEAA